MLTKLTDGKISIGAYTFPDRKKPCLCVVEGNRCTVYGHFRSAESAEKFMTILGQMVGAVFLEAGAEDGK